RPARAQGRRTRLPAEGFRRGGPDRRDPRGARRQGLLQPRHQQAARGGLSASAPAARRRGQLRASNAARAADSAAAGGGKIQQGGGQRASPQPLHRGNAPLEYPAEAESARHPGADSLRSAEEGDLVSLILRSLSLWSNTPMRDRQPGGPVVPETAS